MRKLRTILFLCISLFITLEVSTGWAYTAALSDAPVVNAGVEQSFTTQERVKVLIKLKEGSNASPGPRLEETAIKNLQSQFCTSFSHQELTDEIRIARKMHRIPWISAKITQKALDRLRHHQNVALVEQDIPIHASLAESGPQIKADWSYYTGYTGMGINVAVLDTGIDTDHPDLQDSVVWEECFLSDDPCPVTGTHRASGPGSAEDDVGHGSHVSGIITSDNATYRGIAPDAGIVAVKLLNSSGGGTLSDLVAALDWVTENHETYNIRIVNMSLGGPVYQEVCDNQIQSLAEATEAVKAHGIALFAASGNDGEVNAIGAPACLSSVISVGAVYDTDVGGIIYSMCADTATAPDQIACFSNVATILDLLVPGALITSAYLDGGAATLAGTSMACPHAAGTAALLLEADPDLTPDDLLNRMSTTGTPLYDARIGQWFARINAAAALGIGIAPVVIGDLDADDDVDGEDLYEYMIVDDFDVIKDFAGAFGRWENVRGLPSIPP